MATTASEEITAPPTPDGAAALPASSYSSGILLLVVFVGGMTSLATELAGSRLLAPFFGTSLYIWAVLVGLILLYLTAGYFLGGRLADRWPRASLLFQLTAWAGLIVGIIPLISRPIL